jgi:hypothetical protein
MNHKYKDSGINNPHGIKFNVPDGDFVVERIKNIQVYRRFSHAIGMMINNTTPSANLNRPVQRKVWLIALSSILFRFLALAARHF